MPLTVLAGLASGGMIVTIVAAVLIVGADRRRVRRALTGLLADDADAADLTPRSIDGLVDALRRHQREADQERHDTHDRLTRLDETLSAVPEGVVVCDETGAVRYRNEVARSFEGARHGEALAEVKVNELLQAALTGTAAEDRIDLYGPPRRALLIRAHPLYETRGEGAGSDREVLLGAVAIIEDVSERRRLEAIRRDFVANVSHELKSPVGALGILAETMQAEDEPAVSRRLAERMQAEAFRVARIIDDLLDLSRIESEEAPVREPLAVSLVVAQAVERIRPVADHRNVTIDVTEPSRRLTLVGDRRQLVSAIHNLLENAVKYSDDGSTVEVRVRALVDRSRGAAGGTTVEISVRDYGIGIPARDLERIFERFYRVDRARARDTGGTGLGLSIVRHVATNHRGEVSVDSREGEGSTFTLRLPAAPGPVALSTVEAV